MSSYLFAWLVVLGLALGSMANLMLHSLTGGPWFDTVRAPLLAATRLVPLASLLGAPILFGMRQLYPIGSSIWFDGTFFIVRSVLYLVLWSVISLIVTRPRARKGAHAAGLILYVFSVSLASFDWIGSLVPQWHSTGFGLVVAIGQMLGAMALAIATAGLRRDPSRSPQHFHDLGNLLLMYVMSWAYLAYTQFLIIWAGNLPDEIAWYVPRLQTGWQALAVFLVLFHFFVPFAILLSRAAKRAPHVLGTVAAAVLLAHVVDVYWLVAPSVRPQGISVVWADALAMIGLAALGCVWWRPARA